MIAPPRPPSHDALEALIKEARARQLRRRLLGVTGVAIAAAIGLSAYALTIGGWGHTKLTTRPESAGLPLCRSTQLSVTAGMNGATGTMDGVATLTNAGATACALPLTPPRVSIFWRGKQMPARQRQMSGEGSALVHVLAPGAKAAVHMDWYDWCGKPSEGTLIRPILRQRFRAMHVAARAHVMTLPRCGTPGTGTRGSTILVSPPLAD
jgi:Domain of unknown function (DUF4232)